MRATRLLPLLLAATSLGCATAPSSAPPASRGAAASAPAPGGLVGLDGAPLAIDLKAPPRPVLLVFGASWCKSCAREAPQIKALAHEVAGQVEVVAVVVDPELAGARRYVARHGIDFTVAWDPELAVGDRYGVDRTPTLVLLSRRGELVRREHRLSDELRAAVRAAAAPATAEVMVERSVAMMGTDVTLLVRVADEAAGEAAIEAALAEMRRVEALMSSWRATSQVSAINRAAGGAPVVVDAELFGLLVEARELAALTDGAFDVTFAGAGRLWDFRAERPQVPAAEAVRAALTRVGIGRLTLDAERRTARLAAPGMALGLGGIAKGYAVDRAVAALEARGLRHFVVNAGGDVYARGRKSPTELWWVAVRHPRKPGTNLAVIPVSNRAVVTSGDYERYFVKDGRRYAHILDPRTGYPAEGCQSVTIVAGDAARADALATGVFVLGPERGMALVEQLEATEALIVAASGELHVSSGLRSR